jgi:hypothetical protein
VIRNTQNEDLEEEEEEVEEGGEEAAGEQDISTKIHAINRPFIASVK